MDLLPATSHWLIIDCNYRLSKVRVKVLFCQVLVHLIKKISIILSLKKYLQLKNGLHTNFSWIFFFNISRNAFRLEQNIVRFESGIERLIKFNLTYAFPTPEFKTIP